MSRKNNCYKKNILLLSGNFPMKLYIGYNMKYLEIFSILNVLAIAVIYHEYMKINSTQWSELIVSFTHADEHKLPSSSACG